jgi:hypothetical protein
MPELYVRPATATISELEHFMKGSEMAARPKSAFELASESRAASEARGEEWHEFEDYALDEMVARYEGLQNPAYAYEAIAMCLRHRDKFAAMVCGDDKDQNGGKWPALLDWAADIVATGLENLIRDGSAKGKPDPLQLLGLRKEKGQWNWLTDHRTETEKLFYRERGDVEAHRARTIVHKVHPEIASLQRSKKPRKKPRPR